MSLSWYYLHRPPLQLNFIDSGAFNGSKLDLHNEFYMNNRRIGDLFPYSGHVVSRLNESYSYKVDDEGIIGYIDLAYSPTADNYHLDTILRNNTKRIKFGKAISSFIQSKLNISQETNAFYRVMNENYYDLLTSLNYHTVNFSSIASCSSSSDSESCNSDTYTHEKIEIGLYDHEEGEYIDKRFIDVTFSTLVTVNIHEMQSNHLDYKQHLLSYNIDMRGFVSLSSYVVNSIYNEAEKTDPVEATQQLTLVTYNLWHTNPPPYLFNDARSRWNSYEKRIQHFISHLADVDVVLLQEVRLDNVLRDYDSEGDVGSQTEYLLSMLPPNTYQYVYHPMMNLLAKEQPSGNILTEGLCIMSKYEIVNASVFLLPRNVSDSSDDHQRGVLTVSIRVNNDIIDVMTTHLSLSPSSRVHSINSILEYASSLNQNQNRLQILGGDFNAEPHEDSIRVLSENWKDTYATQYPDDNGYTFPTNDPIKRIDYFFMNDVVKQVDYDVKIIGREPTKETLQYIEVDHGMLDEQGPQYASDHLGLKLVIKM